MELVVIFGPPAVGKMTVGHELCRRTGFKLFHNHMTVEPLVDIFAWGSPSYVRLVNEFRTRIIEEAVAADLPGLVFTFVWALELQADCDVITSYLKIVESRGGRVRFVELYAEQAERLVRNATEFRLDRKRSTRDLDFARSNLLELDEEYVMNTGGATTEGAAEVLAGHDHLLIDNSHLEAGEVADRIVSALGFPT